MDDRQPGVSRKVSPHFPLPSKKYANEDLLYEYLKLIHGNYSHHVLRIASLVAARCIGLETWDPIGFHELNFLQGLPVEGSTLNQDTEDSLIELGILVKDESQKLEPFTVSKSFATEIIAIISEIIKVEEKPIENQSDDDADDDDQALPWWAR